MTENRLILLSDVYEIKKRKEEEIKFYSEQLEKLNFKMFLLQKEIDITNLCIELIEKEKIVEIKKAIKYE